MAFKQIYCTALLGVFILSGCSQKEGAPPKSNISAESVKQIEDLVTNIKQMIKPPVQIDSNVRWDDFVYDPNTQSILYTYSVSDVTDDFKNGKEEKIVEERLKSQSATICADPLTKAMLEHNIPFGYAYFGPYGEKVASFSISPKSICG